jgi:aconitate hydratase
VSRPPRRGVRVALDGEEFELGDGSIVIAAITSCTNTSNPQVMIGAGLLAKKAVELGLRRRPWVKSSLAPGSRVVTITTSAGLQQYLDELGFNTVGYGCDLHRQLGPLPEEISRAIADGDSSRGASATATSRRASTPRRRIPRLAAARGRVLAGRMDLDLENGRSGQRLPARLWPTAGEIQQTIVGAVGGDLFASAYADVFAGDETAGASRCPRAICSRGRSPTYGGGRRTRGLSRERGEATDVVGALPRRPRRLGDHGPHLAGGLDQAGLVMGRYLVGHGVEPRGSTRTAHGAATTR